MSKKLKKSSLQMAAEAAEAYVPVDEDFENNFDILLGGIECLD